MVALDMLLGIGALVLQSGEIFTERQSDEQISNTLDAVAKSTRFLLESVFVGAITTAIGGYVAARIAKRHSYFNGVALGAVGALLGLAFWAEYPLWFNLAALATVFPASLLGAHVAVRLGASGAEPGVQPGSPPAGVPVATPSDRGDGGQAASCLLADGRKNTDIRPQALLPPGLAQLLQIHTFSGVKSLGLCFGLGCSPCLWSVGWVLQCSSRLVRQPLPTRGRPESTSAAIPAHSSISLQ